MTIIDLRLEQPELVEQVATLLRDAFAHFPETFDTPDEARAEVIVPDTNDYGKPDILMSKRVGEMPKEQ